MIKTKLLLSIVSILFVPAALYAANASDVLKRAEVADQYVSYRGMKVATLHLGRKPATASLKVVHLKPDMTRTEYFSPEPLAGIVLIQDGNDFWRYNPRNEEWQQMSHCGLASAGDIRRDALENYIVSVTGVDQVAGRPAYVIHADPRFRGESNRRLWVDKEYYVIMKTQVETPQGRVINSSSFTNVDFNPENISPSAFKVSGKVKPAPKNTCVHFQVMRPTYMPKGYKLVGTAAMSVNGQCCSHLQFSNGANTFSLFQHKADKNLPAKPISSKVTNVIAWAEDGMQFTLMGDISRAEMQKIADSVK